METFVIGFAVDIAISKVNSDHVILLVSIISFGLKIYRSRQSPLEDKYNE